MQLNVSVNSRGCKIMCVKKKIENSFYELMSNTKVILATCEMMFVLSLTSTQIDFKLGNIQIVVVCVS